MIQWRSLLRHKWKFFIFSTLVKVVVVASVFIATGSLDGIAHFRSRREVAESTELVERADDKVDITFTDYFDGKFSSRSFYPNWISGTEYIYMGSDLSLKIKDLLTGNETEVLPSSAWLNTERPYSWSISPDGLYVLITSDYIDNYAHYVRTFKWSLWDLTTKSEVPLSSVPADKIQKFKWSNSGHNLAYVRDFDLYITVDFQSPLRLTDDGEEGMTFNGITDWLYVGEITDDDALFWWSPNDDYLAFASVIEKDVHQFEFSVYDAQYPTMVKLPYPKPGTTIPQVRLSMFQVASPNTLTPLETNSCISGSLSDIDQGFYLNIAVWRNDVTFCAMFKNRVENELAIRHYTSSGNFACDSKELFDDVQSTSGWLGHYKPHDIIPMTSEMYALVQSNDGFPHIRVVSWDDEIDDYRTSGNFEVTDTGSGYHSIFHYDDSNDWIYFTSTETDDGEGLPSIRQLWRVKAKGDNKERQCISCQLEADRCKWVTPSFSTDGQFLVVNCGGSVQGIPMSVIMRNNGSGEYEFQEVVENNDQLQETLQGFNVRNLTIGSIKLPEFDDQTDFYYILSTPPDLDETKKYPLLVEVYSGPGYQKAVDRYSFGWKDYVASSLDVIVMSFDGRGTGFRGDEIMHQVYRKLGQMEPKDQIEAVRQVVDIYPYIDGSRTAIWGWSYGGYATTRTIEEDADNVFKCGLAVAPVTDWMFYHSIYTERFMLQPKDNVDGYERSTALQQGVNVGKHRYVVLHGTRDENVHFQNTARLEMYLVENDIDFGAYFFADNDHGMGNTPNNYRSVYKTLTREMQFCFGQPSSFGDCCS